MATPTTLETWPDGRSFPYVWELLPWQQVTLDAQPSGAFYTAGNAWGFNPSVLRRANGQWLCTVRYANYCMPGGVGVLSPSGRIQNQNVILELDPIDWSISRTITMRELDGLPRVYPACTGFEDLRLVETSEGALYAIATAMQLSSAGKQEAVLLDLSEPGDPRGDYQIVNAVPLRGDWSRDHQKNWTPYAFSMAPRLVYSVERGGIYELVNGDDDIEECVQSTSPHPVTEACPPIDPPPGFGTPAKLSGGGRPLNYSNRGTEIRIMGGAARMSAPAAGSAREDRFPLRGGSQLIPLPGTGGREWLGVAHGMRLVGTFKFYWHVFYTMDARGVMQRRSPPMKLSTHGIEFCAGLALDISEPDPIDDTTLDRLVLSFGTEDYEAHLGITNLQSVIERLEPVHTPSSKPRRRLTGIKESL